MNTQSVRATVLCQERREPSFLLEKSHYYSVGLREVRCATNISTVRHSSLLPRQRLKFRNEVVGLVSPKQHEWVQFLLCVFAPCLFGVWVVSSSSQGFDGFTRETGRGPFCKQARRRNRLTLTCPEPWLGQTFPMLNSSPHAADSGLLFSKSSDLLLDS